MMEADFENDDVLCPFCNKRMGISGDGTSIHCEHTMIVATDEGYEYIHNRLRHHSRALSYASANFKLASECPCSSALTLKIMSDNLASVCNS